MDALGGQPRRARGLRADHRRLQRVAGRVHGGRGVLPAGRLQRRDRRGRGRRRPAVPARHGRPDHAQLGVGGVPPAARLPTSITDNLLPDGRRRRTRTRSTRPGTGTRRCRSSPASRCSTPTASASRPIDEPWTIDEFDAALATLKAAGYETPLDIGAEDKGEWWSYAYSPMLQSVGRRPHRPRHHAHRRRRAQRSRGGRVLHVVPGCLRQRLRQQLGHDRQPGVQRRRGRAQLHRRLERHGLRSRPSATTC